MFLGRVCSNYKCSNLEKFIANSRDTPAYNRSEPKIQQMSLRAALDQTRRSSLIRKTRRGPQETIATAFLTKADPDTRDLPLIKLNAKYNATATPTFVKDVVPE